jgi:trimethylamine--corrinoid protein Co-methyltransferase
MILGVLSERQIKQLHDASLEILRTVGVRIPHPEMRRRFLAAGAAVDETAQVVSIPEDLVERSLAMAGKSFTLYGRDRSKQARFGQGARNYNSSGGQALWVEDSFAERRYAGLADVATAARLADGLPRLTITGAMADPNELPIGYRCVAVAATLGARCYPAHRAERQPGGQLFRP